MRQYQLGDIVQATSTILDENVLVAEAGHVGHVVQPLSDDNWPNVYFERSGRVSICTPEEVVFLGDAETGKQIEPRKQKERINVRVN
jgi:hypothetical protein